MKEKNLAHLLGVIVEEEKRNPCQALITMLIETNTLYM